MPAPRLGFLVNPIAGMGGALALKGTDGAAAAEARARGARPVAPERARIALAALGGGFDIVCAAGAMGEDCVRASGWVPAAVIPVARGETSAADTRAAAAAMRAIGVDLLLFVGGDGAARDVFSAIEQGLPALGAPAGVKMHSAVFAATARLAGAIARDFLATAPALRRLADGEIIDREGNDGAPALFGAMRVPEAPRLRQAAKASAPFSDAAALEGACRDAAALCADGRLAIIGPGATTARVKALLGDHGTLLGVDAYAGGRLVARDAGLAQLRALAEEHGGAGPPRIVVSPIGGQGFLFGRGNQQIGPEIIRAAGKDGLVLIASPEKLAAIEGGRLLVDSGDEALDSALAGFVRVLTGSRRTTLARIADPADPAA